SWSGPDTKVLKGFLITTTEHHPVVIAKARVRHLHSSDRPDQIPRLEVRLGRRVGLRLHGS
ncbi:uncharacterized protein L969DRAFT_55075, partial [Mixia osmundae IAM 14324]